ncbi:MAG: DegT/DnrJ/EryC1/StrS family aminotransferase [Nanoarchaeota archaeon]|nr:DegT/DnrJ/EryC1/StrS family aminotransferase [Nanoarchaeota archaeon]
MNVPLVDLKRRYLSLKEEIDKSIKNVIENTAFINGPDVKLLEKEFAEYCNANYGIGCGNGTCAVHLALKAAGIKDGDEVITVPNTFIATAEAISYLGAKIKFVDIDPETMLMDVNKVEETITSKTKAILPVHLFGQMADMKPLLELAKKYNLKIIEDTAQAHGAEYYGRKAPFHEIATFSFFPAKIMGGFGDAGIVVTKNEDMANKIKLLVNHGRTKKYEHLMEGYNYRLDTIQAAVLRPMLNRLDGWVDKRRGIAKKYNALLKDLPIETPVEKEYNKHAYYMYVIKTENRDELKDFLKEKDISTGIHYPIPLHLQSAYKHLGLKKGDFPVAEECSKKILSLPFFPEMTDEEINYVVENIKLFFASKSQ